MIKKNTLPWFAVLIFAVVIGVVTLLEFGIAHMVRDKSAVATNVTCSPKQLSNKGRLLEAKIYLTMDCKGDEYWSNEDEIVMSFANERKIPPVCTLYKTGRAYCRDKS